MSDRTLTESWSSERRWLASTPTWFLWLYAIQIARLAGVPWAFEEWVRRELASRRKETTHA